MLKPSRPWRSFDKTSAKSSLRIAKGCTLSGDSVFFPERHSFENMSIGRGTILIGLRYARRESAPRRVDLDAC